MWLKKHDKNKLPPISEETQAIFDTGYLFESYAEQIFPDAVRLGFDNFNEYRTLTPRTQEALASGAKTIFQAKFETEDLVCVCDCLQVVGEKTFDLFEIKSTTHAKVDHEYDLAFQRAVLERAGYKIRNVSVVHANNEYVRDGAVDAKKLVAITDITAEVFAKQVDTEANINNALSIMNSKMCPNISPSLVGLSALADWLEVYKTLVKIEDYSIYSLCTLNAKKITEFEKLEIKKLVDVPYDFPLTDKQRLQVLVTKQNEISIDKNQIKTFLDQIKFPLYFLDYETFTGIVPLFDGLKPYEQVPFQYSLHKLSANGKLEHFEYLHRTNSNPAIEISKSLKENIGAEGTVLAWNDSFEKGCNTRLGRLVMEYADFYDDLNSRILDLMTPFAHGHYAHKDFVGSASIKKVLPVLIPKLSYSELDIHDGGTAQRIWMEAILDGKRDNEKEKILDNLLEYCKLDTLAMVEIYKHLVKTIKS
ncbi:MAG: DUF2779 domain-containing protein [Candidatus Berkelbacteria bacterium]